MGIFGWNQIESIRRANLNEAAVNVGATLAQARSISQRTSSDQVVSWTSTQLTAGTQSITLPNGATIVTTPATGHTYTYTAPYGEFIVTAPATVTAPIPLQLEIVDSSRRWHTSVDAVGVTGKPVRRKVVSISSPITAS